MQLIDQDLARRIPLTRDQAVHVLAAIDSGRLAIDLDESMDFDGDLVLASEAIRLCLEVAGASC